MLLLPFITSLAAGLSLVSASGVDDANHEQEARSIHQVLERAAAATPTTWKTTGTGVWRSQGATKTAWITTAGSNKRCGAANGTRTVCATPVATCRSVTAGYSTCRAAAATTTTTSTKAPAATGGPVGGISDILVAHNKARAPRGAKDLIWSDELVASAKAWAEKCVWQHGGANGAGQNLAAAMSSQSTASQSGQAIVNMWMAEEKDYDPNNPTYSHFTQVVWKASTHVGCWQQQCPGMFSGWAGSAFTVCNYSPAGNYIGRFKENVTKL